MRKVPIKKSETADKIKGLGAKKKKNGQGGLIPP